MKLQLRLRWSWPILLLAVMLFATLFYLRQSIANVMHPALDELSSVPFAQRWSHPQMLKIRDLGVKAVPALRRVLREKNDPTIRFLLWVKTKWPGVTRYYPHFPDPYKLRERCSTACQVLRMLGPAGRPAVPEIIGIFIGNDTGDPNAALMALYAIGIDAEVCEQLDGLWEKKKGIPEGARSQIVSVLGNVKPPSARTLKVLVAALTDPSPYVQERAAESLGRLGVRTPEIISGLKHLQTTSTNSLVLVSSSGAIWDLEKNSSSVLPVVCRILESELANFSPFSFPGGGGQGVSASEHAFMMAGFLFQRMKLSESEKSRALAILESCCEKSDRIFIRMLLLPAMMDLGLPREECVEICKTGLSQSEIYYRHQAARLLATVEERYAVNEIDLNALIHDPDVGVRVYAAKIHWRKYRQAQKVVPVLIEALDRAKHQSFYFSEILPVALSVLSDIGPEAHDAIGALEKLLTDPNPTNVKLASDALANIRR